MKSILVVHGGAGDIADSRVAGKLIGIKKSLRSGIKCLRDGGSSMDAVETAVRSMELDSNFNAGYGSVLNLDGEVACDASVMEGKHLKAGCVAILQDIMHPISVARKVMEKTIHTFLAAEGALNFARCQNFEILPPGSLVTESAKAALAEFKDQQSRGLHGISARTELGNEPNSPVEPGTVGAVAIDCDGNIAAATSTGGIVGKLPGRIGDSPLLGCGTYADNETGGVSTTGHGESIMRFNLAQRILSHIKYNNSTAQEATKEMTTAMTKLLEETGGAITIDKCGTPGICFTSKRMAWGYVDDNKIHFGINRDEHFIEDL